MIGFGLDGHGWFFRTPLFTARSCAIHFMGDPSMDHELLIPVGPTLSSSNESHALINFACWSLVNVSLVYKGTTVADKEVLCNNAWWKT